MTTTKRSAFGPMRTTYRVQRTTTSNNTIQFDSPSSLRAAYATLWVQQHGGRKAPLSGLIRRALCVYVTHLEKLTQQEALREVRGVANACDGESMSDTEIEAAKARLEASEGSLPTFRAILLAPYQIAERDALHARLEQLSHIQTKDKP